MIFHWAFFIFMEIFSAMLRQFSFALFLIFNVTTLLAQDFKLKGVVVDSVTNEPLGGCILMCSSIKKPDVIFNGAYTDEDGSFQIFPIEHQELILTIQAGIGYPIIKIKHKFINEIDSLEIKVSSLGYYAPKYYYTNESDTIYFHIYLTQALFENKMIEARSFRGKACNGKITTYHINGNIFEIGTFKDGKPYDGEYKRYYESGNLSIKGQYKKGEKFGQWIYFNENVGIGSLFYFDSTGNGKPKYFYIQNSDTVFFSEYDEHNKWTYFSLDSYPFRYCQGKPCNGKITTYYINGNIYEIATYKDGYSYDGEYKRYNENGNLSIKGQYNNGKKLGQWIYYNKLGSIETMRTYDEKGNKISEIFFCENGFIDSYNTYQYNKDETKVQEFNFNKSQFLEWHIFMIETKDKVFIHDYEFAEGILKNTKDIEVKK